jgi:hypothetical protein
MLFLKDREMCSNSLGIEQGRTTRTICRNVTYPKFKYLTTGLKIVFENKISQFSNMLVFILLLTAGVILLNFSINTTFFGFEDNAFIATVYAQSDLSTQSPEERELEDYLSSLNELQNQSSTNESSLVDESIDPTSANDTDLITQQLATDVSGHYSNPNFGILDFFIPSDWYGSEKQWSGDKSISLDMHEGTETEYQDRLFSPPSADGIIENEPIMTLGSNDKAQLQFIQSGLGGEPLVAEIAPASQCKNLDGSIRFLEPNSTVTIDGKAFSVFTMECKWETDFSDEMQMGNFNDSSEVSAFRGSSTEVSKTYRYDSPERIYSLQLKVSKDLFSEGQDIPENVIDLKKYAPIIDGAVQTLKIE